jgi:methylenetetrahydrofolate dehydrogenase (NADP+)/methenyltetrahydrofolate cyclohydrolase
MSARLLDGQKWSAELRRQLAAQVLRLREAGVVPGLAAVLVGDDPASHVYVRGKTRACREIGIADRTFRLPADAPQAELFGLLDGLNADPTVHGILVQLPLPSHLDPKAVLARIHPRKDVDGFHPLNVGRAFVGDRRALLPATPAGILELLRREGIGTEGRHVVIVGRSLIVSKPLFSLLVAPGPNATVTMTHKYTPNLADHTRQADILVVAVGKPGLITADMVKPGAVVVDVGINRVPDPAAPKGYRVVGDVDFAAVAQVAGAITPVPGGVGPMTVTMLLRNTVRAARWWARRQARVGR